MDRTVSVFGGLALAASLIACSGVGGGNAAPSNASTAVPASPSVHTAGRGTGLMTGSQLKVLLLGEQDMPSGFRLNPKWAADSGGTPYPPLSATPTAPSARQCDRLTGAPWLPAAGLSPTSFAANGFRDVYRNEIDQMVAVYPRAGLGESVMTNLAKLFTLCSSFTSTSSGQRMRMTLKRSAGPVVGDGSIKAVMTSSIWQGGETLVAIRVGNAVASVSYISADSDLGAGAVTLATKLAARLDATQ